jgi:hypothetical protein
MARGAQSDIKIISPGVGPGPTPLPAGPSRRLSSGHLVMIVSGLLATLLTYSILHQAAGSGTAVLVAAQRIPAGSSVDPSMFTTIRVKASSSLVGLERSGQEPSLAGQVAAVDIPKGALVEGQQFRPALRQPPRMTIQVDPQAIPGGPAAVRMGSTIDVIAVTQAGVPLTVSGLVVVGPPSPAKTDQSLSAPTTVPIEVAVPDLATAEELYQATAGKFEIRVSDPGSGG